MIENVIERAMILNPLGPLIYKHLMPGQQRKTVEFQKQSAETDTVDEVIYRYIRRVLSITKGQVNGTFGANAWLDINPSTSRNRMK